MKVDNELRNSVQTEDAQYIVTEGWTVLHSALQQTPLGAYDDENLVKSDDQTSPSHSA